MFKWLLKHHNQPHSLQLGLLDQPLPFWKPFLLFLPALLTTILFTIIPFFLSLQKGFSANSDLYDLSSQSFSLRTFQDLFSESNFVLGLRNSFLYSLISLPFSIIIAIVIASAIVFVYKKLLRGFWQTVFFLPYVTSGVAISIAFVYIFDSASGILNTVFNVNTKWLDSGSRDTFNALWAILIFGVWKNLAFNVLIISTAMLSVNPQLYKVASLDSANPVRQFFKITLPSIRPTLIFLTTLLILGGMQVFPLALFENKPEEAVANGGNSILLYIFQQIQSGNTNLAGAATLVLFVLGVCYGLVLRNGFYLIEWLQWKIKQLYVQKQLTLY
ncbi:carbohydrate ABC transporter permease [Mycoplasmoides genitalium]|uniref:Probable ABC transporter permease protein MG188 n=1 Tax=Mycoplasma genitalium (strain ATCC 33530 / DSM 19775 / NCTC 10195 / G37) TaxID=243273 RepID=Y188_MYCGE|nr:sugar ABC transporter permease [Mycoplasmoides genitalium]P47434.1 RecName: Full=Probable ABC transporter permease protein MG188 [Mycoplasmoides genitalium G37]AAC71407.1 ABC transporter, permease protein [Mycoplasmoides genitalium G37]ABY79569.1 ABC transporter, permease protein [synthetic Mycoplasma genitalium JCVI-1.0]AFQ03016.1 ABC transporter permease [Mycoplasmoides genitalium M2321]